MSTSNIVHLLWTGGWDSTFRLLVVLLQQQKVVQPYYLIDCDRPSFGTEIRTLRTIRNMLVKQSPECQARLLPVIFKEISEIAPNPTLTKQYRRLSTLGHLGPQYEWLARFADDAQLFDLELAIHKDDKAHRFLEHAVVRESANTDSFYRLQDNPPNPDLQLFRYFKFPLFDRTKLEMQRISASYGFEAIMEHTWFCHTPLWDNSPCGTCGPCRYTREEGLSRRISLKGQARYYTTYRIKMVVSKLRQEVRGWRRY